MKLTPGSEKLMSELAHDGPNWNGNPLLPILSATEKGNLTDLKVKGLLDTEEDTEDNCVWVFFTALGREYSKTHYGFDCGI